MARFFIVLLLLTVGSTNAEVRLKSAIDISKLLTAEDKVREAYGHRTFEIAFSRDEKLVAIAVGSHETVVGLRTHILVLGVAEGKTKFQKDLPGTYVSKLDWSSDDRKLLVQSGDGSWIFDLEGGGEDCHTGELGGGGFVGPDSFAIVDHTSAVTV